MTKKTWIIFAAVCVIVLGGLIALSSKNRINVDKIDTAKIQPSASQSGGIADHVYGKADSKVVLVEYGDYQCPGCGSAYATVKALSEKYKDQIGFVFRNFPLTSIHPNARAAAAVAEAAGLQGKYWEMHDLLYTNQEQWSELAADKRGDQFTDYATQLGLDVAKFTKDVASPEVEAKISFDQAMGQKNDVTGTPMFFLNSEAVNQYHLNGKLVPQSTEGSQPVWSDQKAFDTLVLRPFMVKNGITPPKE